MTGGPRRRRPRRPGPGAAQRGGPGSARRGAAPVDDRASSRAASSLAAASIAAASSAASIDGEAGGGGVAGSQPVRGGCSRQVGHGDRQAGMVARTGDRQEVALDGRPDELVAEPDPSVPLDEEAMLDRLGDAGGELAVEGAVRALRPGDRARRGAIRGRSRRPRPRPPDGRCRERDRRARDGAARAGIPASGWPSGRRRSRRASRSATRSAARVERRAAPRPGAGCRRIARRRATAGWPMPARPRSPR